MYNENYTQFLFRELDAFDLVLEKNLNKVDAENDLYSLLNTYMRLQEEDLHILLNIKKEECSEYELKLFLNDLIIEIDLSSVFINSLNSNYNLTEKQLIFRSILSSFNDKVYKKLRKTCINLCPSVFINVPVLPEKVSEFEIKDKIEVTESFRFAWLIANGSIRYDANYYFENGVKFASENSLANKIQINAGYLNCTRRNVEGPDSKNIFTEKRVEKTHKYILEKMKSMNLTPSNFYKNILLEKGVY